MFFIALAVILPAGQIVQGIDPRIVFNDAEVQVGAGGIAGIAGIADHLSLRHLLIRGNIIAAEMAVQAEKDGAARLNAVISGAQERMREAKRQAGQLAAAFEADLNSKTAAQCRALEQAAASRSGAAAAMIVERIWDSEWQS